MYGKLCNYVRLTLCCYTLLHINVMLQQYGLYDRVSVANVGHFSQNDDAFQKRLRRLE